MTRPGIEPRSPGPLANTLLHRTMRYIHIYVYIHIHMYMYAYIYVYIYPFQSYILGLQWCAVFIADFGLFLHHISSDSNPGLTLKEPSRLRGRDVLRSSLYQSKEKINKKPDYMYIFIYTYTQIFSICTTTYQPSRRQSKLDEQEMRDTDGGARMNSKATFSYIYIYIYPGKGVNPSLQLGVVAIEKGIFGSLSTEVANFTYIDVYICTCIYIYLYICLGARACVCVCMCNWKLPSIKKQG